MSNKYYINDERQRYVQKSGEAWEISVLHQVNAGLKVLSSKLKVIMGKSIPKNSKLWNKLAIPVGKKDSIQKKIWGDIDLVVVDQNQNPAAIISCKTSLHGRFSETLFYAVVLRDLAENLKIVFATPDKGRQHKKGEWQSEWGSEEKPTKDRLLGSHYLDGVYIANEKTVLGGIVKPLAQLPDDLEKWAKSNSVA